LRFSLFLFSACLSSLDRVFSLLQFFFLFLWPVNLSFLLIFLLFLLSFFHSFIQHGEAVKVAARGQRRRHLWLGGDGDGCGLGESCGVDVGMWLLSFSPLFFFLLIFNLFFSVPVSSKRERLLGVCTGRDDWAQHLGLQRTGQL
jgi:hypothetical protein